MLHRRRGLDIPVRPLHLATMAFALVLLVASLVILWLAGEPLWIEHRRRLVRAQPFPAAWREILARRVPLVQRLPAGLRRQLEEHILVFIAEKRFTGCAGMSIDD